jgi:histidinol dehydrogenase
MSENGIPNIESVIATVAARHGILLKPSDAAFALVTINEMLLEQNVQEIADRIDRCLREFEASFDRLQVRAGKLMAQEVKGAVAEIRTELEREIDSARGNASELVNRIELGHQRVRRLQWIAFATSGAILFAAGFWCGAAHL